MANLDINVFSNQGGEKLMPGFLGLGKSGRPEAESQSGSSESELDSLRQLFLERNIKSIDELETRLTPILKLTCSDFKLEPEVRKQAAGIWAYKINKLIPNFQLSADVFDEAEALILEAALRHNDKAEARGFLLRMKFLPLMQ